MDMLEADPLPDEMTLGEIADRYGEPVERIMDALDACRERRGEPSYVRMDDERIPLSVRELARRLGEAIHPLELSLDLPSSMPSDDAS